ncbi:MAG: hypothetical protein JXB48_07330 [Candidatus Latescibacteria bacterium]|nr:hypothetical protein [Candidatus Latescibacterota bacterium]
MELVSTGMNTKNSMFSVQGKGMTASKVNPREAESSGNTNVAATIQKTVTYSPEGKISNAQSKENGSGFSRIF